MLSILPSSFPYLEPSSSSHPILTSAPSSLQRSPAASGSLSLVGGLGLQLTCLSAASAAAEMPSFLAPSSPGLHGPHSFFPPTSLAAPSQPPLAGYLLCCGLEVPQNPIQGSFLVLFLHPFPWPHLYPKLGHWLLVASPARHLPGALDSSL